MVIPGTDAQPAGALPLLQSCSASEPFRVLNHSGSCLLVHRVPQPLNRLAGILTKPNVTLLAAKLHANDVVWMKVNFPNWFTRIIHLETDSC